MNSAKRDNVTQLNLEENSSCNDTSNKFVHKDGGWGWIVAAVASFNIGLIIGILGNYSLIYNELVEVYKDTENHIYYAATIGSLMNGIRYSLVIVGSILVSFFNTKLIGVLGGLISAISFFLSAFVTDIKLYFLTYSIILPIGHALLMAATFAIIPHYFNKKISLANGIVNAVGAIIGVLLPAITSIILERYSLKILFFIFSILHLTSGLLCLTYIPCLPVVSDLKFSEKVKQSFGSGVFRKKKFLIWCIASFIAIFGWFVPIINIAHYSLTRFPDFEPVYINITFTSMVGIASIVFGKLGDLSKFNRVHYHTFCYLFYGILCITLTFSPNLIVFIAHIIFLGILDGIWLCYRGIIARDLVESSELANQASGYFHLALCPMTAAGPSIAGQIYEYYHSYNLAFYLSGLSCIIASAILIVFILVPEIFGYLKKSKRSISPR